MGHTIMAAKRVNGLAALLVVVWATAAERTCEASEVNRLELLPYPQEVNRLDGVLSLGPPDCKTVAAPSATEQVAWRSLRGYLPKQGKTVTIRVGSVDEGYDHRWLTEDQQAFLAKPQ